MKKTVLLFLVFSNSAFSTSMQSSFCARDSVSKIKANSVFFEFGGTGLIYSFNYERVYPFKNNIKFSARVGLSYVPTFLLAKWDEYHNSWRPKNDFWWPLQDNYFSYPVEFNVVYGKKHGCEFGISNAWVVDVDHKDILKVYDSYSVHFFRLGYSLHVNSILVKFSVLKSFWDTAGFHEIEVYSGSGLYGTRENGERKIFPWWLGIAAGYSF